MLDSRAQHCWTHESNTIAHSQVPRETTLSGPLGKAARGQERSGANAQDGRAPAVHLTRSSEQKSKTLEQFYAEWDSAVSRHLGGTMLRLIERLRSEGPDDWSAFGLTSHAHLYLLPTDDRESLACVHFIGQETQDREMDPVTQTPYPCEYYIEYRLPDRLNPWPPQSAWVKGIATSEDDAVRMILAGMHRSEGWYHPSTENSGTLL